MSSGFASTADLADKTISFDAIGPDLYAFTAEGDPNSGIIVGDDGVMVVDAQATPVMAQQVIDRVRTVTDKPIKYVLLSHYHAVRVLGASAYRGAEILASAGTRSLIVERGKADMDSEIGRFPRLFRAVESIPGLTWPSITFPDQISVWLGKREVRIMHIGRGHTAGDVVAYVPDANVVFSGDLVEYHSACYCGDAHLREWPLTLNEIRNFNPKAIAPGRGDALNGLATGREAIAMTRVDGLHYEISRRYPSGTIFRYLYDRGSFQSKEVAANGLDREPRRFIVPDADVRVIRDTVYAWSDTVPGGVNQGQPQIMPTPYNPAPWPNLPASYPPPQPPHSKPPF